MACTVHEVMLVREMLFHEHIQEHVRTYTSRRIMREGVKPLEIVRQEDVSGEAEI
jgi:hypothetical protein